MLQLIQLSRDTGRHLSVIKMEQACPTEKRRLGPSYSGLTTCRGDHELTCSRNLQWDNTPTIERIVDEFIESELMCSGLGRNGIVIGIDWRRANRTNTPNSAWRIPRGIRIDCTGGEAHSAGYVICPWANEGIPCWFDSIDIARAKINHLVCHRVMWARSRCIICTTRSGYGRY
jgi:hypothetical protein